MGVGSDSFSIHNVASAFVSHHVHVVTLHLGVVNTCNMIQELFDRPFVLLAIGLVVAYYIGSRINEERKIRALGKHAPKGRWFLPDFGLSLESMTGTPQQG